MYNYFFVNYIDIETLKFPFEVWKLAVSFNSDFQRPNNAIEDWHNILNSNFVSFHYRLPIFIEKLKYEEDTIRIKCILVWVII